MCVHFGGAVLNKQKKYGFSVIDVKIFLQMRSENIQRGRETFQEK